MLKQLIAIILFSVLVILMMPHAQTALQMILTAHNFISEMLTEVFSGGAAGNLIRQLLALLAIPILVALVPALVYWLTRRHWLPHFMSIVGVIWLVQTSALIIQYKAAVPVAG
ncbi:MAG: hypothetical protein ACYCQI_12265 [Gammaproteobacteria bacterium]